MPRPAASAVLRIEGSVGSAFHALVGDWFSGTERLTRGGRPGARSTTSILCLGRAPPIAVARVSD